MFVRAGDGEQMHLPQLLPDGDSVLFTVTKDRGINRWMQAQVVVQSRRTGQRTVLAADATDGRYLPSGHLVFARGDGLFGSAFDVKKLALTGATVSLLQDVQLPVGIFSAGVNYDVSNDGTLVYVSVLHRRARRCGSIVEAVRSSRSRRCRPVTTTTRGCPLTAAVSS